jgi:hypothetical protein
MTRHKLMRNEFRLEDDTVVSIEYWADAHKVQVAAFDATGRQITRATYQAALDPDDQLTPELQETLVNSLANALEYGLINHPDIHLRKR